MIDSDATVSQHDNCGFYTSRRWWRMFKISSDDSKQAILICTMFRC